MGRRRAASPHPGVYIVPRTSPRGRRAYRAKYTDPDSGRVVWETLDPLGLPNKHARERWAKEKAKSLGRRRAELSSGAPQRTSTDLGPAITEYLEQRSGRLGSRTIGGYRADLRLFSEWAARRGVRRVEQLTSVLLS